MSRLKLKQILSNLEYNETTKQLKLVGASQTNVADFVISGSMEVTSSIFNTGSITIKGIDSFGDSGSFYTVDLGEF